MKETSFIEQNKEKWKRFQDLAARKEGDPEEIADLYSDITDDLSYAQTFYNRRTVRVYLNQIAQSIHNLVHRERGESFKKFFTVWRVSLPLEIYRSRKHLLFALCITIFWALLGAVSTYIDPDFSRTVMGSGYVEETYRNIANGTPLDVYTRESQLTMFFGISIHNIKIAFLTFIFGFFFTIGTHILLFGNGVMIGTFQTMFYTKGVLLTSFLGIWIHGAFEISSIVIAGGAGITMGNGWLFPGSYTRLQSLQLSAKRGLKIMMSLVPFLLMAGFLESYVTRNYQLFPEWSKWVLIMFCFAIILFYFVFYPMYVAYKYPELVHEQHVANHTYKETFNLNRLRTFGQMFADTFAFYRVHIGKIFKINALITLPLVALIVYYQDVLYYDLMTMQHWYDWSAQLKIMMGTHMETGQDWLAILGWTVIFTMMCASVLYCFKYQEKQLEWRKWFGFLGQKFFGIWLCNLLIYAVIFLVSWYWLLLIIFLVPFVWLNSTTFAIGDGTLGERISNGFRFGARSYGNILLSISVICLILFLFSQLIAFVGSIHDGQWVEEPPIPDLLDIFANFVKTVARSMEVKDFIVPANVTRQVVYILFIFLAFPLFVIMMGFIHSDISEKNTAKGLKMEFASFGKRRRNQETAVDFE